MRRVPGAARPPASSAVLIMVLCLVMLGVTGCRSGAAAANPSMATSGKASGPDVRSDPTSQPESSGTTPAAGVPRGLTRDQLRVDSDDPDQVAVAFVVRLEAWDTALDRRPNDAARRAVRFASARLSRQLLSGEPVAAPGRRWDELERHHGWTSVQTRLGGLGPPPTSGRTAVRAVTCTPTDHGDKPINHGDSRGGGNGGDRNGNWIAFPPASGTYLVRLERRQRTGWTVVGYTIQ